MDINATVAYLLNMADEHINGDVLPSTKVSKDAEEELFILLNSEAVSPMTVMVASMAGIEHPAVYAFRLFIYYVKRQGTKPMFSDIGRTKLERSGYLAGKSLLPFAKSPVKGFSNHLNHNLALLVKNPSVELFKGVFGANTLNMLATILD